MTIGDWQIANRVEAFSRHFPMARMLHRRAAMNQNSGNNQGQGNKQNKQDLPVDSEKGGGDPQGIEEVLHGGQQQGGQQQGGKQQQGGGQQKGGQQQK